jgi:hypothetical protein
VKVEFRSRLRFERCRGATPSRCGAAITNLVGNASHARGIHPATLALALEAASQSVRVSMAHWGERS